MVPKRLPCGNSQMPIFCPSEQVQGIHSGADLHGCKDMVQTLRVPGYRPKSGRNNQIWYPDTYPSVVFTEYILLLLATRLAPLPPVCASGHVPNSDEVIRHE